MATRPLLDPAGISRISRMELVARHAVEGFLSGRHPSPFHGSSAEYADHRPYSLGDEIKSIDWKLMAKTDKLYVKLFEDQTNLRCTILLDASRSMGFGSASASKETQRLTKLRYASHLAAALSYLMLKQSDAIGLAVFDEQIRHFLPPRATASHFRRIIETMDTLEPANTSRMADVLHEVAGRLSRRGMIILISDMLDEPDRIMHALSHFKHRNHDVLVFHVMHPDELNFPFDRLTRFRDMEGQGQVVADPKTLRSQYLQRLDGFLKAIRRGCEQRHVAYELAVTDQPYDQMLSAYLQKRARRQ